MFLLKKSIPCAWIANAAFVRLVSILPRFSVVVSLALMSATTCTTEWFWVTPLRQGTTWDLGCAWQSSQLKYIFPRPSSGVSKFLSFWEKGPPLTVRAFSYVQLFLFLAIEDLGFPRPIHLVLSQEKMAFV